MSPLLKEAKKTFTYLGGISSDLDLSHKGNFLQDAELTSTHLLISPVKTTAFPLLCTSQASASAFDRCTCGLDKLSDDLLEGMDFVIEQDDLRRLLCY